jgi:hypothetical protein
MKNTHSKMKIVRKNVRTMKYITTKQKSADIKIVTIRPQGGIIKRINVKDALMKAQYGIAQNSNANNARIPPLPGTRLQKDARNAHKILQFMIQKLGNAPPALHQPLSLTKPLKNVRNALINSPNSMQLRQNALEKCARKDKSGI